MTTIPSFRRRPESSKRKIFREADKSDVVPLRGKLFDHLDSGLRRNDGSYKVKARTT
jgi:hypothetical protein